MRNIKYIVVHCSASQPSASVESIKNYWRTVLGWNNPGYHYIIEANGNIVNLLSEDKQSNGVAGMNSVIVNVCYVGGIDRAGVPKDTRTPEQKDKLFHLLSTLKAKYPGAIIQGHKDFPGVHKACPSFEAKTEYQYL